MEKLMNDTIIKPGKAVAMCSDHAGFEMKSAIIDYLGSKGIAVENFGTNSADSCDYPDFAHPCAEAVDGGRWDEELARLAREHNDANILVLPARFISVEKALKIVDVFLNTAFEGGRHQRRIEKIPVKQ